MTGSGFGQPWTHMKLYTDHWLKLERCSNRNSVPLNDCCTVIFVRVSASMVQ